MTAQTKPCEAPDCGATITRRPRTSQAEWDEKRYCNRACKARGDSARWPAPDETKLCVRPGCRGVLTRRREEGGKRWTERRACSRSCGAMVRRQQPAPAGEPAARRKPTPPPRSPKTAKPSSVAPSATPAPVAPAAPPRPVWRPAGFAPTPNTARRAS